MILAFVFLGVAILAAGVVTGCAITENSRQVKSLRDEIVVLNEHLNFTPLGPWLDEKRKAAQQRSGNGARNHV